MALPRKYRLTDKKDLDKVFKEGNAVKGTFLFIKYKKNSLPYPRFAFIVPVKIAGNIASRNRFKRILSEKIRHKISKTTGKYDVTITLKRKEKEDNIKTEMLNLLSETGILNEKNHN